MSDKLGLSGCKLQILSDNVIRKYSANRDYNNRLSIQIDKQNFFSKRIFSNIDTAKIIKKYNDELIYFDMEYIIGCNYHEYFSVTSKKKIEKIFIAIDEYFDFLINNSKKYKPDVAKGKIKSKLLNFNNSQYYFLIEFAVNYLDKIDVDIKKSFCHGDLTMTNILFHSQKIYLIDFLDSYIDTFVLDLIKLKQDLYYHWVLKINDVKDLRISQCFNFIWSYIEKKYHEYLSNDTFYILELINFLRIEPYLTNKNQRVILNNIIERTYLYDEFARSNGREVYKIS